MDKAWTILAYRRGGEQSQRDHAYDSILRGVHQVEYSVRFAESTRKKGDNSLHSLSNCSVTIILILLAVPPPLTNSLFRLLGCWLSPAFWRKVFRPTWHPIPCIAQDTNRYNKGRYHQYPRPRLSCRMYTGSSAVSYQCIDQYFNDETIIHRQLLVLVHTK